jgi:hypothetical protein
MSRRVEKVSSGTDSVLYRNVAAREDRAVAVTIYGVCAVSLMIAAYALESRSRRRYAQSAP